MAQVVLWGLLDFYTPNIACHYYLSMEIVLLQALLLQQHLFDLMGLSIKGLSL